MHPQDEAGHNSERKGVRDYAFPLIFLFFTRFTFSCIYDRIKTTFKGGCMARKNTELRRSAEKSAEKAIKKTHKLTLFLALLFLAAGVVAGVLVSGSLTKNDKFVLNDQKEIRLPVGGDYVEYGATVISFGKDISDKVTISGDKVDTSREGEYQLVYKVDDWRWSDYQLVRVVYVGDGEEA